jgi:hypothetical protein
VFKPLDDNDIDKGRKELLPDGDYVFDVSKCQNTQSKNGNNMAKLTLTVWSKDATHVTVYDYLVFTDSFLNRKKIKDFCLSVGLLDEYKKGEIPSDLQGFSGKCKIGTQEGMSRGEGDHKIFYSDKNIVIDYLLADVTDHKTVKENNLDDLPF